MKTRKPLVIILVVLAIFLLIGAGMPPALRERIAIYAREDSWIANGMDIIWYTGNLSGETHRVDGAGGVRVVAPTAVGTATPALVVDSQGGVSNLFEVRDSATPVYSIADGGGVIQTGSQTFSNTLTVGADGSGYDVTFHSATSGDLFLWDSSEEGLYITGTASQDALDIVDGNVDIDDDIDVNGTTNLDDVDIDLATSLNIDGHMVDIGTCTTPATADGDNDLCVAGDAEIDGTIDADGAVEIASTLTVVSTSDLQGNVADSGGAFTVADNTLIDGAADAAQLTVQGYATQTNSLLVLEQSDGTDKVTVSNEGQVVVAAEADSDDANYDYWFTIEGEATGTGTKDRNYPLYIEMTRPAGQELVSGDHDEAGLKIRVDTEATSTTAGTVLRAIDAEAKADNPGGTVTNLHGALITAKSDTSAGSVADMWGLSVNTQNNAEVTTTLLGADIRLMRQAATEPTTEQILRLRNSSTSGSGADAAIYVSSDYGSSATTDSFDYGLDLSGAAINTADIRLENGETISNGTDTAIVLGGFLALTEGAVIDLGAGGTITPTASYQPITNSTGGSITTDTSTAIADGAVAGTLLIICNEDAQDVVIDDGANTDIGGNQTLTGGAGDCISLIWNGSDWNKFAPQADN